MRKVAPSTLFSPKARKDYVVKKVKVPRTPGAGHYETEKNRDKSVDKRSLSVPFPRKKRETNIIEHARLKKFVPGVGKYKQVSMDTISRHPSTVKCRI